MPSIRTYRCIQLLEKILNDALHDKLAPAIIGIGPLIQVFTQFVCVKLYSKIPLPGFLVFPIILINSLISNLVIQTLAAKVNSISAELLLLLKSELSCFPTKSKTRKQNWKELTACKPTRIQFGQNFVDMGTPLVIENFCINQTVSILLLSARSQRGN